MQRLWFRAHGVTACRLAAMCCRRRKLSGPTATAFTALPHSPSDPAISAGGAGRGLRRGRAPSPLTPATPPTPSPPQPLFTPPCWTHPPTHPPTIPGHRRRTSQRSWQGWRHGSRTTPWPLRGSSRSGARCWTAQRGHWTAACRWAGGPQGRAVWGMWACKAGWAGGAANEWRPMSGVVPELGV